ncbi:MAG: CDP-alcohol phosphatidyltransferase family protein [Phycisphaeraceae bacterium]|nr:CDP-alcohol phosphatidyltransferase family protein [Phycisphaeraceae bacterium]
MHQHIPNMLTIARLVLSAVFFLLLNQYRYPQGNAVYLWVAMGVFIIAALTDIADGYLARRLKVESTFGRIMDPFADKVLNIGAFIYLAGSRFVDPIAIEQGDFHTMISGIYPWMVVMILARELLVTGIRGEMEGRGIQFGANIFGKMKTLLQCIGIPFLIGIVALDPRVPGHEGWVYVQTFWAYAIVITTVLSGIPYIRNAYTASKPATTIESP